MIKFLIRFLLSLCILLLSGYSHLHAHAYQELSSYALIKNLKGSEHVSFRTVQNVQTFISSLSPSVTEKSFKVEAAEIEEEENKSVSFKKYLENSNYLTAVFYVLALAYFFRYIKTSLLFCKHFSYTLSQRRYLIFHVFRI